MNQPLPLWLAVVGPVGTLLGTMLIVMTGVFLQNRALERAVDMLRAEINVSRGEINSLRAEIRQQFANWSFA